MSILGLVIMVRTHGGKSTRDYNSLQQPRLACAQHHPVFFTIFTPTQNSSHLISDLDLR